MRKKTPITKEEILAVWKNGSSSIDWRHLASEMEKIQWLRACLMLKGLPHEPITAHNWIIDGNHVTCEIDFFCLLGETFFGYGGYFGQDSHGFNDCFSEIRRFDKIKPVVAPGANVTFKNSSALKKVFGEAHFSLIIQDFKSHGFEVVLE